ncbi:MAG: TonB-dependent receptor [Oceanicoccus sp.]
MQLTRLKTRLASRYVSAVLLTTCALTAAAQTSSNKIETVTVTASRSEQSLGASTASLSVVSEEDLLTISHIHISEALSRVPGVWVSRGNGQESLTAIRSPVLTGAGSCGSFTVAEDGIPARATGFCNVNQLFDINTEQAQRIEVLRGPGTVLHGSDALHGVINVITKAPASEQETLISLEAGSNDFYRAKISQSGTNGEHGYRINLNGVTDGGYKDDSGFDQQKMTARHDFNRDNLSIQSLLSISNLNQETAGYVEGKDAYKDDDRKRENPNPEAFRDTESYRLQSQITLELDNGGSFIATPYARYTDMDFLMHFLPGTPLEENGQKGVGIQTAYIRPVNQNLMLTQGFDAEYTDAFLKQSQDFGFSSFPQGQQYDYDVTAKLLAAFITADYQLLPTTTLSAGTRYEYLEYDYDNRMIDGNTAEDGSECVNGFTGAVGCRYTRPSDSTDDFDNWSVNAGINHQINDSLAGIVRLAHGFRAPQATEMYRLQNGQLEANLDSEEINSLEIGLRGARENISFNLTTFYMTKTNTIFQSSDRLNLADGKSEHYGLEYDLTWQLSSQWDVNVAGTFARHYYDSNVSTPGPSSAITIESDGNDIDTAPRHMSSVQLGWTPTEDIRAELEWVSMGKYYTDIDNLHSYDGHDLLSLRVIQQLSKNISIGLRINNLTDTDYAERADYTGFNGDRYFIGEPRSYRGNITYTF